MCPAEAQGSATGFQKRSLELRRQRSACIRVDPRPISCRSTRVHPPALLPSFPGLREPLARAVALLAGGLDDPLLARRVAHLARHPIEPGASLVNVAHATPQLADEIGDHRALLARERIVR